jgi:hypothetical protein
MKGGMGVSKRKKCATCGQSLQDKNYHLMYDAKQGNVVKVCRDDRLCQTIKKAALAGDLGMKAAHV